MARIGGRTTRRQKDKEEPKKASQYWVKGGSLYPPGMDPIVGASVLGLHGVGRLDY